MNMMIFPFQVQPAGVYLKFPNLLAMVKAETIHDALINVQLNHQGFGLIQSYNPLTLDWFQQPREAIESSPTQPMPEISPLERKKVFINGLRLAADEHCVNPEDAEALRSIADRIFATLT